jgi:hypothetical protein
MSMRLSRGKWRRVSESRNRARQRGTIVVWFAVLITSVLSFIALAVDVARLNATRTQLQNVADEAALAGATAVDAATGRLIADLASRRAQEAGVRSVAATASGQKVSLQPADVELLDHNRVRVTVRRSGSHSMIASMGRLFGVRGMDAAATAVAVADTAEAVCNIAPLGIVPPDWGEFYQVGTGRAYTFKHGTTAGGDGNYRPLNLSPCYDGPCAGMKLDTPQNFECQIENGFRCCLSIGELAFLERRNWSTSLRTAIQARFDADTDHRPGIRYSEYQGNGNRLMFVPMTTPEISGYDGVHVTGLAAFFLKSPVGAGPAAPLVGEFVYAVAPGSPGGHPEVGGPAVFAVHLVREKP